MSLEFPNNFERWQALRTTVDKESLSFILAASSLDEILPG